MTTLAEPPASPAAGQGDAPAGRPEIVTRGPVRQKPSGWLSWLTTVDHKRIGIM